MYRTSEKTSLSRKMAELEDRWRKCQEDRYILELKFKEVLKGLANKNEGNKLLKIKEKYNHFLENEDSRNERNDGILRTLDKIESQANMLSAKTERLKLLKLHYEAYMKRMYPSWENEVNPGEIFPSKGSVYSGNCKFDDRNANYSTHRDNMTLKNKYSSTPYSPRQNDASHVNHQVSRSAVSNGQLEEAFPRYQIDSVNTGRSSNLENAMKPLNRDLFGVGENSEGKTTDSRSTSFEKEENTSKDLLNVSLSEDQCIDNSTIPVGTGKGHVSFHPNRGPSEYEGDRISVDANGMNRKGNDSDSIDQNKVNVRHDNTGSLVLGTQSDRVSEVVQGDDSGVRQRVAVTPNEDDINLAENNEEKSPPNQNIVPTLEVSDLSTEGEVGGILGDDCRNEVDEEGDVVHSPIPSTSYGTRQRNVEEPFQFSSSDADYDELENEMAAVVEGRRNDENNLQGMYGGKDVLDENLNDSDSPHCIAKSMRGDPAAPDEDNSHQVQVRNDNSGEGVEGGIENRENYTFSEKEEDDFIAGEHLKGTERDGEHSPTHRETVNRNGSSGKSRSEIVEENTDDGTRQGTESYYEPNTHKDEEFINEEGNESNRDSNEFMGNDEDRGILSVEEHDKYHGGDTKGSEITEQDPEYIHERNTDLSVEQIGDQYDLKNDEPPSDYFEGEIAEEHEAVERQNDYNEAPSHWNQNETGSHEEKWGDVGTDEVSPIPQEDNQADLQENMEVEANYDYIPDQVEEENPYSEHITEPMHSPEEIVSKNDDEMYAGGETEGSQEVRDVEPEYATWKQEEAAEVLGEESEREHIVRDEEENIQTAYYEEKEISNENYARGEVETEVGGNNDRGDRYATDIDGGIENNHSVVDAEKVYIEEDIQSTVHEGNLEPNEVQDHTNMETDTQVAGEIMEETPTLKEAVENVSEYYAQGTMNELEQSESILQEQKIVEKADTPESVETNPDVTSSEELKEVNQEEIIPKQISENEMHSTSDIAAAKEIEKIIPEEVQVVPQKISKKEEVHPGKSVKGSQRESTRKDAEKAEKSKETPQIPSRPQSRQSGRKEGSSPDTYKGEKLKTAIRKFQAKKDTRQTTRRTTDSKK
ncbi:uncharacterized protein LOC124168148 [Ischnura elegans]|uniref:uncharacterized protein LOC124168148 n=1 Tax=Ischnura elegans TaxID=197161 RepID=UPI001ED8BCBD|nr:uncharacterized protein LOC124168148 [Ischnura elegans]